MVTAGVLPGIDAVQVVVPAANVPHPLDGFPLKHVGASVGHPFSVGGTEQVDACLPNGCTDYLR